MKAEAAAEALGSGESSPVVSTDQLASMSQYCPSTQAPSTNRALDEIRLSMHDEEVWLKHVCLVAATEWGLNGVGHGAGRSMTLLRQRLNPTIHCMGVVTSHFAGAVNGIACYYYNRLAVGLCPRVFESPR